jgi:hypothetical protein
MALDVISSPSPLVQIGLYLRARMALLESGTSQKHWRLRGGHRQALRSLRQENRMRRRKAQVGMNASGRRPDQCSIAMKKNRDKSATWHNKRATNEKVKS